MLMSSWPEPVDEGDGREVVVVFGPSTSEAVVSSVVAVLQAWGSARLRTGPFSEGDAPCRFALAFARAARATAGRRLRLARRARPGSHLLIRQRGRACGIGVPGRRGGRLACLRARRATRHRGGGARRGLEQTTATDEYWQTRNAGRQRSGRGGPAHARRQSRAAVPDAREARTSWPAPSTSLRLSWLVVSSASRRTLRARSPGPECRTATSSSLPGRRSWRTSPTFARVAMWWQVVWSPV